MQWPWLLFLQAVFSGSPSSISLAINSVLLFVFWATAPRRLRWRQRPGKGQHPLCEHHPRAIHYRWCDSDISVHSAPLRRDIHSWNSYRLSASHLSVLLNNLENLLAFIGRLRVLRSSQDDAQSNTSHSLTFLIAIQVLLNIFFPRFQEGKPQGSPCSGNL